jgi:hypothetical protein
MREADKDDESMPGRVRNVDSQMEKPAETREGSALLFRGFWILLQWGGFHKDLARKTETER